DPHEHATDGCNGLDPGADGLQTLARTGELAGGTVACLLVEAACTRQGGEFSDRRRGRGGRGREDLEGDGELALVGDAHEAARHMGSLELDVGDVPTDVPLV